MKRAGNAEKYEKVEENQLTEAGIFDTMKKRQKTAGQKKAAGRAQHLDNSIVQKFSRENLKWFSKNDYVQQQSKDWVRCCFERSKQGRVQFLENNNNSVKAECGTQCVSSES